jgi:protein-S-isoprenylcysteine O-methyltransferase Ste14
MSLIPAFDIGVWNAWIPTTFLLLFIMLSGLLPKGIGKRIAPSKGDKNRNLMLILFFIMIIYSIFLPLKLESVWFYVGLTVYILGFTLSTAALFSIAATKPNEPFTTVIYRYSRHPISLGTLLPMIGAGIASASWLFLLLSVILFILSHFLAINEEIETAKKFGDAYRGYINRTPRWLGIPKAKSK